MGISANVMMGSFFAAQLAKTRRHRTDITPTQVRRESVEGSVYIIGAMMFGCGIVTALVFSLCVRRLQRRQITSSAKSDTDFSDSESSFSDSDDGHDDGIKAKERTIHAQMQTARLADSREKAATLDTLPRTMSDRELGQRTLRANSQ